MATLRSRARARGPSCESLVDRWDGYEDDADFGALTERWSEDDMRTNIDIETQYRAACEAVTERRAGEDVQVRCLTDDADLRAEDGDSRIDHRDARALRRRGASAVASGSASRAGRSR